MNCLKERKKMLQTIFSNLLLSPDLIMYTIVLIVVFFSVSKVNLSVHEDKNRVPYVKVSGVRLDVLDPCGGDGDLFHFVTHSHSSCCCYFCYVRGNILCPTFLIFPPPQVSLIKK